MSESTGNVAVGESDTSLTRQPARRLALPIVLSGGASAAPIVCAVRQDYTAGLIASAPMLAVTLLIFFFVVCPAVWSTKPGRQSAALAVLDRLLGRPNDQSNRRRRRSAADI
ncbi:hypothetical protein [Streptomyces sp. NRRL S-337]|uniref:hypothetical protein n=1 Tax=Streptomyces sp. NRRL S-337 TaxID=1463900 RepID=UPI0004C74FBF|nr:hypothetical protein [Streptomyces sp. NRRL S-337]